MSVSTGDGKSQWAPHVAQVETETTYVNGHEQRLPKLIHANAVHGQPERDQSQPFYDSLAGR